MNRILIVSWEYPPLIEGGLARHVRKLSEALVELGVEVHVLTRGGEQATIEEQMAGVQIHRIVEPERPTDLAQFVTWVERMNSDMLAAGVELGDRYDFDLVHGHDWLVASACDHLARRYGTPLVTTIHATEFGRHQGWVEEHPQAHIHGVEKWIANRSDRVIACSLFMKEQVGEVFAVEPDRVTVIPNGIDPADLPADDPEALARLRAEFAAPDQNLVLLIGRLVYEKGFQLALEAMPEVIREVPNTRFLVAGSGTHEAELHKQAEDLGLMQHGTFLGWIGDDVLHSLYRISDLTVVPSIYEPFGLVALEAMASRVPLHSRRHRGPARGRAARGGGPSLPRQRSGAPRRGSGPGAQRRRPQPSHGRRGQLPHPPLRLGRRRPPDTGSLRRSNRRRRPFLAREGTAIVPGLGWSGEGLPPTIQPNSTLPRPPHRRDAAGGAVPRGSLGEGRERSPDRSTGSGPQLTDPGRGFPAAEARPSGLGVREAVRRRASAARVGRGRVAVWVGGVGAAAPACHLMTAWPLSRCQGMSRTPGSLGSGSTGSGQVRCSGLTHSKDAGRHATDDGVGRYVLGDHGVGADDRVVAHRHAAQDAGAVADPDIRTHPYVLHVDALMADGPLRLDHAVVEVDEHRPVGDHAFRPDPDVPVGRDRAVLPHHGLRPDLDQALVAADLGPVPDPHEAAEADRSLPAGLELKAAAEEDGAIWSATSSRSP